MPFIPDPPRELPCSDDQHYPPSLWLPQTSGTWVCPSCGARTRVAGPANPCTGLVPPKNPPGVYTQGECCGNCVVCPYAVKVTFTVSDDASSTALDAAVREVPARVP
jgi:hypothetical protein